MKILEKGLPRKIIDTNHAVDRFYDKNRFDIKDKIKFKKMIVWVLNNAMHKIIKIHGDKSGIYVIHSKSTNIGIVIEWRKDNLNKSDKKNHAIVMTLLPLSKKHYSKHASDILLVVEQTLLEHINRKDKTLKEYLMRGHSNTFFRYTVNDSHILLWEGTIYDVYNVEKLEVK